MSTLTVQTISNGTISTSTANVINGAKAWVNFNVSSGSSAVIRASYNVSSVTYVATGQATVNYTNAFADANYSFQATASAIGLANQNTFAFVPENGTISTSATSVCYVNDAGGSRNPVYVFVAVFR
jgi:hypothetical protein